MADKRISQLVERTDIANNDVLPIVASGATTTNKVTISTIQDWMQENLDVGVTSVGLSMPSAFTVTNSPVTTSGNISVVGAGTVSQYIRGDGSLADFPSISGGGSSVSYYLNGSVSQGTIGGIAYRELNKVPILGTGTDFVAIADGYLASFITDAGDPSLLLIPGGNWNFETYFSASSGGGTPTFYVELYKVDSGGTATLIASNSTAPELIAFGTTITPYFSTLAVPTTTLTLTDRLAIRYYIARSGRTITLHTENGHLCQIITTFTTGLTALNGLTAQVQNLATGTSGSDFNIVSSGTTHTFNIPSASSDNRGLVTTGAQNFAGNKSFQNTIFVNAGLRLDQNGTALPTFVQNISGTGLISSGSNGLGFNSGNNLYFSGSDKGGAVFSVNNSAVRTYTLQDANGTLAFTNQIPTNPVGGTGTTNQIPKFTGSSTIGNSNLSDDGSAVTCSTELRVLGALNGTTASLTSTGTHLSLIRSTFNTFTFAVGTASGISGLLIGNNTAGTTPLIINQSNGAATFSNQITSGSWINTPNAVGLAGRNAANTAFRNLIILNSSNQIEIGRDSDISSIILGTASVTNALTINSDGSAFFNYPILGSRSFVFRTISGRPLTLETVAPTGVHSFYLRANDSGRHLISSNYLSGGVYLPLALSGRENDTDFVLNAGNVGIGTASPGVKLDSLGVVRSSTTTLVTDGVIGRFGFGSPNYSDTLFAEISSNFEGANWFRGANLIFKTSQSGDITANNSVERMRITAGGYLVLGGSSSVYGQAGRGTFEMNGSADNMIAMRVGGSLTGYLYTNASSMELYSTNPLILSTAGSEQVRITTDRYLRMASGTGGIQFNGDTAAANALDDYEEGTWTPAFIGGGGNASYNSRRGWYTKIGRQVTIVWEVSFQKNTISSTMGMSGLPFTVLADSSAFYPQGTVLLDNLSTTTNNITFQVANGSTQGDFIGGNGGTTSHTGLPASSLGSGTMMCRGSATYYV